MSCQTPLQNSRQASGHGYRRMGRREQAVPLLQVQKMALSRRHVQLKGFVTAIEHDSPQVLSPVSDRHALHLLQITQAAGSGASEAMTSNPQPHGQDWEAAQERVKWLKAEVAERNDNIKTLEDTLQQMSAVGGVLLGMHAGWCIILTRMLPCWRHMAPCWLAAHALWCWRQELACRKAELAECNSIADGSAAEQMLQAMSELQQELCRMDVQTGVLQDQLWKARMHGLAGGGGAQVAGNVTMSGGL